ncbi:MAG: hypothetical protein PUJ78_03605 [Coriobacteriaceae bacterium]|nr:hypothetical protein [Coriobacteriaceae bacterium]
MAGVHGPQGLADATGKGADVCAEFWKSPVGCDPLTRAEVLTGLERALGAAAWGAPMGPNGETLGELVHEWERRNFPLPTEYERTSTMCRVAAGLIDALYLADSATVAALYGTDYAEMLLTAAHASH